MWQKSGTIAQNSVPVALRAVQPRLHARSQVLHSTLCPAFPCTRHGTVPWSFPTLQRQVLT